MLATGLIVVYGYFMEFFMGFYSGNTYEEFMIRNRLGGPYWLAYWALIFCNAVVPQILWVKKFRENTIILFIVSIVVNIGMWLERFVIIVTSLHRDYLPSSWGMYYPSIWDWGLYIGSIGLFFCLLFIFIRLLPVISVFEMRELVARKEGPDAAETSAIPSKYGAAEATIGHEAGQAGRGDYSA